MTVSYANSVASAKGFEFLRLLARWRGSVYKLLWKDLTIFLSIYYLLHILYMSELSPEHRKIFEALVYYCSQYGTYIPLSFVLGFFVSNVMTRWWNQYQTIPWPTTIAVYVSSTIHGYDEVGRAMRRTIMRYVCLSLTMVLRVLSPRLKKRFPKMADFVEAGFLHENELAIIEDMERKFPGYSKNFMPIVWAAGIVTRARKEGRINDDYAVKTIIKALNRFRGSCGVLMTYNTITIPLVYTQVVTLAVYAYFLVSLIGQQFIENNASLPSDRINLDYVPVLIIMQFIFYMGWLKVAETLMNPFGEDDDDFEVNSMIDRNLQMSYVIVDNMHDAHPELLKDQYWDEMPQRLPDISKDISKDKLNVQGPSKEQDIVDFEIRTSGSFGRSEVVAIVPKERKAQETNEDIEAGTVKEQQSRTSITINPSLIPHPSVISAKFISPEVIEKQKILEQQMERIRRQSLNPDSESESSLKK